MFYLNMFRSKLGLGFLVFVSICLAVEWKCLKGYVLALASYYVWPDSNLSFIAEGSCASIPDALSYNPEIPNQDSVLSDIRINLPLRCNCINGHFLGRMFQYSVQWGDTFDKSRVCTREPDHRGMGAAVQYLRPDSDSG